MRKSKQHIHLYPYGQLLIWAVGVSIFITLSLKAFKVIDAYHLTLLHCGG